MVRRLFASVILCLCCLAAQAQPVVSTVPYRLVAGKLVLDMAVDGTTYSFVLDTGGQTSFLKSFADRLGWTATDTLIAVDANNETIALARVAVSRMATPDGKIVFSDVPALLLEQDAGLSCFGAVGIIGSDMLGNMILSIDGESRTVTLAPGDAAPAISLRRLIEFDAAAGGMPIIPFQVVPGITLKALFDTGSPQLLSLRAQDYQRIGGRAGVQCLSRSYGESNIGISGQRQEEEAMRVGIPALSVGSVKFESVVTTTAEAPVSLLGTELLTYGRITIDYPRRRLYYEAYRPDETHRPEGRYADVELTVKEGHLVVARVWGEGYEGIAPGDRVVAINGKPVDTFDFCESITQGIPALKKKKKSRLTIDSQAGEKTVIYERKPIRFNR